MALLQKIQSPLGVSIVVRPRGRLFSSRASCSDVTSLGRPSHRLKVTRPDVKERSVAGVVVSQPARNALVAP